MVGKKAKKEEGTVQKLESNTTEQAQISKTLALSKEMWEYSCEKMFVATCKLPFGKDVIISDITTSILHGL